MPLIFNKTIESINTQIGVWEHEESDDFFINGLCLSDIELDKLSKVRKHRRLEWLSSRYLLKILLNDPNQGQVLKDTYGKPYLVDSSLNISLSHSKNRVAAIVSPHSVGIDIQRKEEKIVRIHQKFISLQELKNIDQNHPIDSYHIFWGAKESMYKSWGKRELDFRKNMHLYPFKNYCNQLELKGWVEKEDYHFDYDIYTERLENYFLVYAITFNS